MVSLGLNEGMRVFSYGVSGFTEATTSSLPFVDSEGDQIFCSYFKVTLHFHPEPASYDPLDHIIAWVEIPGAAIGGISAGIHHPVSDPADASGMCGLIAIARGEQEGVVEWKAPNDERINGIKIHIDEDFDKAPGEIFVFLTYGNIVPFQRSTLDKFDRGD